MTTGKVESPAERVSEQEGVGRRRPWKVAALVLLLLIGVVAWFTAIQQSGPIATLTLADGRILQIEGVGYGTEHQIGRPSLVVRYFGPWLPQGVRRFLEPEYPESRIHLDRPGLVVWVNARDPFTGKHVDCQGIRAEFVGKAGDLFGEDTSSWFGGQSFWRVGHVFYSYPRDEKQLKLRITPYRTNVFSGVTLLNPKVAHGGNWSGAPLPQSKSIGKIEIIMSGLTLRTNGAAGEFWRTASRYWEPSWEFRENGKPTAGWETPEWFAEDATGNRGQYLGIHQPVLRYSATVYPQATNVAAGALVGSLPRIDLAQVSTNIWWNRKYSAGSNEIVVLGLCPPGMHQFSDGDYDTNGPAMAPVRGGAPSGWVSTSRRMTPLRVKEWHGHYTPNPTLYVRAPGIHEPERLAVRLRDDQGRYWAAKPESQGSPDGIHPFLLELPADVTNIVPDLVLLKPVQAEFLVETKNQITP